MATRTHARGVRRLGIGAVYAPTCAKGRFLVPRSGSRVYCVQRQRQDPSCNVLDHVVVRGRADAAEASLEFGVRQVVDEAGDSRHDVRIADARGDATLHLARGLVGLGGERAEALARAVRGEIREREPAAIAGVVQFLVDTGRRRDRRAGRSGDDRRHDEVLCKVGPTCEPQGSSRRRWPVTGVRHESRGIPAVHIQRHGDQRRAVLVGRAGRRAALGGERHHGHEKLSQRG